MNYLTVVFLSFKKNGLEYSICLLSILLIVAVSCKDNVSEMPVRYVSAKKGLNLREIPDTRAKRLATVPYGEKVTVLESTDKVETHSGASGKWMKVSWSNNTGWVFGGFLDVKPAPDARAEVRGNCGKFNESFFSGSFKNGTVRAQIFHITLKDDKTAYIDLYDHVLDGKWRVEQNHIIINCSYNIMSPAYYNCSEGGTPEEDAKSCLAEEKITMKGRYGKSDFSIPVTFNIIPRKDGTVRVVATGSDRNPVSGKKVFTYSLDEVWDCPAF